MTVNDRAGISDYERLTKGKIPDPNQGGQFGSWDPKMVSDVGWVRVKILNSPLCHPRLEMECGYSLNRVNDCLSFSPGLSD
jgi:hypothetical protein